MSKFKTVMKHLKDAWYQLKNLQISCGSQIYACLNLEVCLFFQNHNNTKINNSDGNR
jgi:hypothetical protein